MSDVRRATSWDDEKTQIPARDRKADMSDAPATARRPIRVLLVENNPGDARIIVEMLREVDEGLFHLQSVDRLEPALKRLGRAAVDIVLLTLDLPDSVGLDTFRRAHREAVEEPIIVISGFDDEETVDGGHIWFWTQR